MLSVNPNGIGNGPEFVVGSSTATHLIVTNTGNVGIGTTAPTGQLTLNTTYPALATIDFNNTLSGTMYSLARITGGSPFGLNAEGYLHFWTKASQGGVLTERMTINYDGNVGIGTTGPEARLDVNGTIWQTGNGSEAASIATDYMRTNSDNAANGATNLNPGGILLFGGGAGANVYGIDFGYHAAYGPRLFTAGDIYFDYTASPPPTTQSNFTNLVTIKGTTGNVGIGPNTPAHKI